MRVASKKTASDGADKQTYKQTDGQTDTNYRNSKIQITEIQNTEIQITEVQKYQSQKYKLQKYRNTNYRSAKIQIKGLQKYK